MGSFCNSDPTTTTQSSSTYQPSKKAKKTYNQVVKSATNAASRPFTPYQQPLVAGVTPQQQAGMTGVDQAVGTYKPYFDQASGFGTQGASAISPDQISQYMDPYTQSVVDAVSRQFANTNAEQQQGVIGNAAIQGALGGNRVGVAQGELARQQKMAQDPVIAGLYSQGYGQALSAAQQDKQRQMQAADTFGNLGTQAQNAALQGPQAQMQAGQVAQNTEQARLQAEYDQFMREQNYPFMTSQFLAQTALPAAGGLGGTTSGSSSVTQPSPSAFSQIAGLGTTALGGIGASGGFGQNGWLSGGPNAIFNANGASPLANQNMWAPTTSYAARGGRIGYAPGGAVDGVSFGEWPLGGEDPFAQDPLNTAQPLVNSQQMIPQLPAPTPQGGGDSGGGMTDILGTAMKFLPMLMLNKGGAVKGNELHGHIMKRMAGGGNVGTDFGSLKNWMTPGQHDIPELRNWMSPQSEEPSNGLFDALKNGFAGGGNVAKSTPGFNPIDLMPGFGTIGAPGFQTEDPLGSSPMITPEAIAALSAPEGPDSPMMLAGQQPQADAGPPIGEGNLPDGQDEYVRKPGGLGNIDLPDLGKSYEEILQNLGGEPSDDSFRKYMPLIQAGLGMMAGTSPFGMSNIGAGGMQGIKMEGEMREQDAARRARAMAAALQKRGYDLDEVKMNRPVVRPFGSALVNPITGEEVGTTGGDSDSNAMIIPNEVLDSMAEQALAGDNTVFTHLGHGNVGAVNNKNLRAKMYARGEELGLSPTEIAAKAAEFGGFKQGQRTLATKQANTEMAATEAGKMIPIALTASANVDRTQYPTLNSVLMAALEGTGDENVVRLAQSTNAVINTYARAISPSGAPTVDDKIHAREILNQAWAKGQYAAGLDQMAIEINAALESPVEVKKGMRSTFTGEGSHTVVPRLMPQDPSKREVGVIYLNPTTGEPVAWDGTNIRKVTK